MKKGFMLGLVLCTSAAFALDVYPTPPATRMSNALPSAKDGTQKNVKASANDRSAERSGVKSLAKDIVLPPVTAAPVGSHQNGGMRDALCDNPLYETTEWDGSNGLFNSRSGFGYDARVADDVDFDSDTTVGAIHWMQMDLPGMNDISTGDLLVLPDDGNGDCLPNQDDSTAYFNQQDMPLCRVDTGNTAFGFYELYVYTINVNGGVGVPAGKSWWAARPYQPSGYGYEATSHYGAPTNCDGAFRSPTFGDFSWVSASTQFGTPSDFSFCLTGSGGGAGACCTNGDCTDGVSQSDCENGGGTYQGDGSFCCSIVCPGSAQACCFDDGSCQNLKPGDCAAAGGTSQGDGVNCAPGLCPLPDFCADSIFSQFGYDGVNGIDSQDSGDIGWIDAYIADNAVLTSSSDITGAVWQTVDDSGVGTVSVVDYEIHYTAVAGGPGPIISSGDNVNYDVRLAAGTLFGRTVYEYKVTTTTTSVVAGSYYVALRPRIEAFAQSFYLTAAGDGVPGYFKSPFFGYANWTSTQTVYGVAYDFSFCLLGQSGVGPYGACCLEDQSVCAIESESDCGANGGVYYGDDSSCLPSPCPNQPGACCFGDGTCQVLSPTDCTNAGGNFVGGGTDCGPGVCPLPDFCGEGSLYSQFGYDGFDGLDNQNSGNVGWIDAWSADDANVSSRGTATGVVAQNVTRGSDPVDFEDAFLAYDSGAGPGVMIINIDDTTDFAHITDGTQIFGGTIWVDKVNFSSTRLVPGEYYTSARERIDNFVQSFLLTTGSGGGLDSYFQSAFFGFPNWVPTSTVLGQNVEFSFCLLGQTSADEFGACCTNDETTCALLTEAECNDAGGRYVGTDTPCFPAPCTNTPGACCFLDPFGCTDGLTQSDCEGQGGTFQGGSTDCTIVRCPLPDFCADSIYSQFGYDGTDGLANQDSDQVGWIEAWSADDFTVSGYYEVTGIVAQTVDRGSPTVYAADALLTYTSGGGGPGTTLNLTDDTTSFVRATDGSGIFGGTIYVLDVDLSAATRITSGQYYFSARPVFDDFVQSFLLTTSLGGGSDSYFKSAFFGFPNWTDTVNVLGFDAEFSLCVLGNATAPFGACCTQDDSVCSLLTQDECNGAGGTYHGDGSTCSPSPCSNAQGACCLESGACEFVSGTQCEADGGSFQGGDVQCSDVHCPIPDPCDGNHGELLYNNSSPDGVNGLSSEDGGDFGWIVSYTANDFQLGSDATIGALHYYDLHSNGAVNGNGDYQILADNGGCLPDDGNILADVNDVPFLTLDTGLSLFGLEMWQNNTDVNLPISAGHYWVAARLDLSGITRSFWATAPLDNCEAAFKSDFFGFPNWTPWSTLIGIQEDVAYCLTAPTSPCSGVVLGDSNGDGSVDFNDIDCFVAALVGQDVWADCGTQYHSEAYICANDINGDGSVDFNDIDPFVVCLANGTCN